MAVRLRVIPAPHLSDALPCINTRDGPYSQKFEFTQIKSSPIYRVKSTQIFLEIKNCELTQLDSTLSKHKSNRNYLQLIPNRFSTHAAKTLLITFQDIFVHT